MWISFKQRIICNLKLIYMNERKQIKRVRKGRYINSLYSNCFWQLVKIKRSLWVENVRI